jgi:O-antigen/teichoic acid export membrane protein
VLLVTPIAAFAGSTLAGMNILLMPLLWGAAGLVVDLVLAFTLVPHIHAIGAALANNGGQVVAGLPVVYLASRRLRSRWWSGRLLAAALAAAAGGLSAWGVGAALAAAGHDEIALTAGCIAGMGAYFATAAAVKVLGHDDAEWLRDALGPRMRRATRVVDYIGARST